MSVKESYAGKINRKLNKKLRVIAVAAGREPADLVLKNATYVNVFSNELCHGDIAVAEGLIVGMGAYSGIEEVDVSGKIVLPGFVDAHIHLESSLVSPTEFAKAVLPHGTTTVITDPHEIANVMGTDGIEYMLQATEDLPVDVRFMLPSCVPATPLDESGANLDYRAIDSFYDHPRVQGLAEMMNFVGAINGDPQVVEKIVASQAHHKKIDGHAPDLVGNDLNAYIAAGVYSDHECHDLNDAIAKTPDVAKLYSIRGYIKGRMKDDKGYLEDNLKAAQMADADAEVLYDAARASYRYGQVMIGTLGITQADAEKRKEYIKTYLDPATELALKAKAKDTNGVYTAKIQKLIDDIDYLETGN